jgi:Tfp pilus assembly protein PilW
LRPGQHGFSLLEVIVAMGLTMAVTAGIFATMHPAHGAFMTEPEIADMQQRLRVAVDTLTRDLMVAGAGSYVGVRPGSLVHHFAPVLPFRPGASGDDAAAIKTDTITLISVPSTAAQTTLVADLTPADLTMRVAAERGCPPGENLCGFAAGITVLAYDASGSYDTFTLTDVSDAAAQLAIARSATPANPPSTSTTIYKAGSTVVEAQVHTYYLKTDILTQTFQLMHDDGSANVPVVDHIVGLTFDYYGEPQAPVLTSAGATYGPAPPPLETRTTAYAAGENCTFQVDAASGLHASRLLALGTTTTLVPLTPLQFVDGPWCPDEMSANRWDADLLRIRAVAVTIRVEAASSALRGPAGVLFRNGGTSRAAGRWVPDQEIRFQVSPRNLNLGR